MVQIGAFSSRPSIQSQVAGNIGSAQPPQCLEVSKPTETAKMPVDLNGYWKMISSDNFEEYLKALGEFAQGLVVYVNKTDSIQ